MRKLFVRTIAVALGALPFVVLGAENLGTFAKGDIIPVLFNTYGSSNESIVASNIALADIQVFKGVSDVERSNTAGFVLLGTSGVSFNGVVGVNGFSIDTGDHTVAGFWEPGGLYNITLSPFTVNGQTVSRTWFFRLDPFILDSGLARATDSDASSLQADSTDFAYGADAFNNMMLSVPVGTGAPYEGLITDYSGATDDEFTLSHAAAADFNATSRFYVRAENRTLQTCVAGVCDSNMTSMESADPSDAVRDAVLSDATRIDGSDANTANGTSTPAILADTNEVQISLAAGGLIESMVDDLQAEVDGIEASTDQLPSDPADASVVAGLIDAVPTNAELTTALGTADDAVLTVVNDVPTNAELTTALGGLPSDAELTTALAGADDATLAAVSTMDTKINTLTNAEVAMGTASAADSGSTTTIVDDDRNESTADHWKGQAAVPLTGTNALLRRCVTGFTVGNPATITVKPAWPAAITTNTYILVQDASCNGVAP